MKLAGKAGRREELKPQLQCSYYCIFITSYNLAVFPAIVITSGCPAYEDQ